VFRANLDAQFTAVFTAVGLTSVFTGRRAHSAVRRRTADAAALNKSALALPA